MAQDDPLEQFMAEIEEVTKRQQESNHEDDGPSSSAQNDSHSHDGTTSATQDPKQKQLHRELDEEFTAGEGFDRERDANAELIRFRRTQGTSEEESDADVRLAAKRAAKSSNRFSEEDAENASLTGHSEFLLPAIDHSTVDYEPFRKCFYDVSEAIKNLSAADVALRRRQHNIEIVGPKVPHMISDFSQSGLDKPMRDAIARHGFDSPTPIQAQSLPIIMSGRDMIGIAMTGSGKTLAYGWPLCVHCIDQRVIERGEGPITVVLAPTRELVQQVYQTIKPFAKVYDLKVVPVYGGASRWEQKKALQTGPEIVVATPGRLVDLIKDKATNLRRVTMVVLDEADKMLEMGFETAVVSILQNIRPDRQTVMFSATFRQRVEKLARQNLQNDAVRVTIGNKGSANPHIEQHAWVLQRDAEKWPWLESHLVEFSARGRLLVFVNSKEGAEELAKSISNWFSQRFLANSTPQSSYSEKGTIVASAAPTPSTSQRALALHGDKDQEDREKIVAAFKKGNAQVLVATDIASRGLDIPLVQTVVSYDTPRKIDTHTHRVGRTGRLGGEASDEYNPGLAHTLLTRAEAWFAGELVKHFESSQQRVPPELLKLAMTDSKFRATRNRDGTSRRVQGIRGADNSTLPKTAGIGFSAGSGRVGSRQSSSGLQTIAGSFSSGGQLSSDQQSGYTGVFSGEDSAQGQMRKQLKARTASDFMSSFQKALHGSLNQQHSEESEANGTSASSENTLNTSTGDTEPTQRRKRRRTRWGEPSNISTEQPENNEPKRGGKSESLAAAVEAASQQARENALQRGLVPSGDSLYVKGVKY